MKKAGTILIIDDSKTIRLLLTDELQARGYEVETAEDGATGLSMTLQKPYDLVVIDVVMPVMSGYEVCRKLAEGRKEGRPALLIYSNSAKGFQARQEATRVGADAFVAKTVDAAPLLAAIVGLLA